MTTSDSPTPDPTDGSDDLTGRVDDTQEEQAASSTTDGPAADGDYDPAQGSPGHGEHPVGEQFPEETVRYGEDEQRRSEQPDA